MVLPGKNIHVQDMDIEMSVFVKYRRNVCGLLVKPECSKQRWATIVWEQYPQNISKWHFLFHCGHLLSLSSSSIPPWLTVLKTSLPFSFLPFWERSQSFPIPSLPCTSSFSLRLQRFLSSSAQHFCFHRKLFPHFFPNYHFMLFPA